MPKKESGTINSATIQLKNVEVAHQIIKTGKLAQTHDITTDEWCEMIATATNQSMEKVLKCADAIVNEMVAQDNFKLREKVVATADEAKSTRATKAGDNISTLPQFFDLIAPDLVHPSMLKTTANSPQQAAGSSRKPILPSKENK